MMLRKRSPMRVGSSTSRGSAEPQDSRAESPELGQGLARKMSPAAIFARTQRLQKAIGWTNVAGVAMWPPLTLPHHDQRVGRGDFLIVAVRRDLELEKVHAAESHR